ncbi:MAG: HAD family hydrolase [Leptonema sp. (in: bacteria)]
MNLLIFDLDGTLIDTRLDMALSVNRIRKLYQLPEIPIEALQSLMHQDMDLLYKNCFPELIKDFIPEDLKQKYEIHYAQHVLENTKLYAGIESTLQILSKNNFLTLYANRPENLCKLLLNKFNLINYFKSIIGSDSYPYKKPNPEHILKIISQEKVSTTYVIGDSEMDMELAKNLNAKSIWCKWGYYKNMVEFTPDFIAKTPEDLLNLIESKS